MKFVRKFQVGYVYMESNADKGYGKNELLKYHKFVIGYHESTNKHIKIVDQLGGGVYKSLIFDKNCDESYLQEIQDYYENCGTDDCPDSLASILRVANKGKISAGVFKK